MQSKKMRPDRLQRSRRYVRCVISVLIGPLISLFLGIAPNADSAVETSVPISAETGTSIAREMFPLTLKLSTGSLYLTDPKLLFLDARRIGMEVRFQAYDYRPAEGVAISETGLALVSGELGYDPGTRELLLHNPGMDALEFDRMNAQTRLFSTELKAAWSDQVTNPIRSRLPPHPYLIPVRKNLSNLGYDGKSIYLTISY